MAGNFNVHNILWNCRDTDRNGSKLHEAMEKKGMFIVNDRTVTWIGDERRKDNKSIFNVRK